MARCGNADRAREPGLRSEPNTGIGGAIAGKDDQSGLYRIDLYVADAEPNLGPQIDALFGWPGNNCLSSAVRNVLQHCNPRGSNVYTYFVRMN